VDAELVGAASQQLGEGALGVDLYRCCDHVARDFTCEKRSREGVFIPKIPEEVLNLLVVTSLSLSLSLSLLSLCF